MFWIFLLDSCDHAGIWKANWPLVKFYSGPERMPDTFKERVVPLTSEKWFIPKFVDFQYGELKKENRAHASVIAILEKEGAYKRPTNKVLPSPLEGRKDKDKDKEKDKETAGADFEAFWNLYPKRSGREAAQKVWAQLAPSVTLYAHIMRAIGIQKGLSAWTAESGRYIPRADRWLEEKRWEETTVEAKMEKCQNNCGLLGNWVAGPGADGSMLCARCLEEEAVEMERKAVA